MYTIEDLNDILGYSEHQIRRRLDQYSDVIGAEIQRGEKNKILLKDNGLQILRRAKELEEGGKTITQTLNIIKQELNSDKQDTQQGQTATAEKNGGPPNDLAVQALQQQTHVLEEQLEATRSQLQELRRDYKEQLQYRNEEIERLHTIIQNRLPPAEEEKDHSDNGKGLRQLLAGWWNTIS